MRKKAVATGESESLNGLLDTMTNVIGVLILMLLASFLTVREVTRTIEKKSVLFAKSKTDQLSDVRMEGARLDQSLAALRTEAASLVVRASAQQEGAMLEDAKSKLGRSAVVATELSPFDSDTALARLREKQKQLAALQEAVALQEGVLEQSRRSRVIRAPGEAPKPKTRIATVPDPVYPSPNSHALVLLCRSGRVTCYNEELMTALLKKGYETATGINNAQKLTPAEFYQKVQAYFDGNHIEQDGFRWRVRAEYDANDTTAKTFLQLRASIEWSDSELGETLDKVQEKGSAYQRRLEGLSNKTNYLKFLVWSDSFAEYAVAREVADGYGFSSGWLPQQGDGIEIILARTALNTQSPLEYPQVAAPHRSSGMGVPSFAPGVGGGIPFGAGSSGGIGNGTGSVGFGGSGGDKVD